MIQNISAYLRLSIVLLTTLVLTGEASAFCCEPINFVHDDSAVGRLASICPNTSFEPTATARFRHTELFIDVQGSLIVAHKRLGCTFQFTDATDFRFSGYSTDDEIGDVLLFSSGGKPFEVLSTSSSTAFKLVD